LPRTAPHVANLAPGFELVVSGGEARGEFAWKADLRRRHRDNGLVRPVTTGLVGTAQIRGPPFAAALLASGDAIPQRPGIEQGGQQIEQNRIVAAPGRRG